MPPVPGFHAELLAEDEKYGELSAERFSAFAFHLERLANPELRHKAAEAHGERQPGGARRPAAGIGQQSGTTFVIETSRALPWTLQLISKVPHRHLSGILRPAAGNQVAISHHL